MTNFTTSALRYPLETGPGTGMTSGVTFSVAW
jgi:hypothetical protein